MEKGYLSMKIKITILEIGKGIGLKVEDLSIIIGEWYIMGNGKMIKCMEEEKKDGLMELFLQEYFKMDLRLKENFVGQMEIYIKVNLKKINQKDLENLLGKMEGFIKENGKTIQCMEEDNSNGKMDRNSQDIMKMIKRMVKENYNLMMEQLQKGHGLVENFMEKESFQINKEKVGKQSGIWVLKLRNEIKIDFINC